VKQLVVEEAETNLHTHKPTHTHAHTHTHMHIIMDNGMQNSRMLTCCRAAKSPAKRKEQTRRDRKAHIRRMRGASFAAEEPKAPHQRKRQRKPKTELAVAVGSRGEIPFDKPATEQQRKH
jgi:hypothetical protein